METWSKYQRLGIQEPRHKFKVEEAEQQPMEVVLGVLQLKVTKKSKLLVAEGIL